MPWTTDDLVAAIRRQAYLPTVADLVDSERGQFSDEELLAFADEELQTTFADLLRAQRDEMRVLSFSTASTGAAMTISLPERALARAVRRVHYVDSTGREADEIDQIMPADAWSLAGDFAAPVTRLGWYFEGDSIRLPITPVGGSIRVYYQREIPRLVLTSECPRILVGGTSTTVTCANPRPAWLVVGELADVIRGTSPFLPIATDQVVSALPGSTDITLSPFTEFAQVSSPGTLVTRRSDYITRARTSPFPPMPQEWHPALSAAVAARVLESIGDVQGAAIATRTRDERIARAVQAATPRNAGRGERIINRHSALRAPRRWTR